MKTLSLAILAVPALLVGAGAFAQGTPPSSALAGIAAPDNSKSNKVDPSNRGVTADQQGNDAADIDLAQRIRKSVIADKSLSTYGHNVKIVAMSGQVTLNGVVRSADEKAQIGRMATAIAGEGHVTDAMKVAPPQ